MVNFTVGTYINHLYCISGTRILIDHVITALFGWVKQPAVLMPIQFHAALSVFLVLLFRKVPLFDGKYVTIRTVI